MAETVSKTELKKVSFRESEEYLIATNHYMNPDMIEYDNHRGRHSVVRYRAIEKALTEAKDSISMNDIKAILEQKVPNGVFCPYYDDGLGTLHSMAFDLSNKKVEVCLGMPESHKWQEVFFDESVGNSIVTENVINEYADDPGTFWRVMPPGSMDAGIG